jgi:hypothetical protein
MHPNLKLPILVALLICASCPAHAQTGRLLSLSTRAFCETRDAVLVSEFILQGTGTETVVLRGIGPSLGNVGVPDPLQDPTATLLNAPGRTLDANDDWMDNPDKDAIIDSGLAPTDDRESAMIDTLRPGTYTFVEQGTHRGEGVALAEIYDLFNGGLQLSALGTRGFVSTGVNVMISGFIISGTGPTSLLIRALGPSLSDAGLHRVLADPALELHNAIGDLIATNDNWIDSPDKDEIEFTGLAPTDDLESAMLVNLPPGAYTIVLSGANGNTGLGFAQVYSLDLPIRELNPAPIIRRGR